MTTKLTLRMDRALVANAKREAHRRGKSVSRMVADYFEALEQKAQTIDTLPPVTASLFGLLKKPSVSEKDYRRYLKDKYL
jgi:Family of unknown function (DUF6364)